MLLSKFFLPVIKENPSEAHIASHKLMLRSGMIRQQASGIYSWLPLGFKVLKNIENVIRVNLDNADLIEMLMPCIQPAELWQESGRLDNYGKEMLKFFDRHEKTLLFGPTNEDMITDIFKRNIHSYKSLPKNLYHFQWKFRDEIRPRFGVMRAREFLMKDAYSFDINKDNAIKTYYNMYMIYLRIFQELGVNVIPVIADTGPIGGNLSHEFHIKAETGESVIYYDRKFDEIENLDIDELKSLYAVAEEKHEPQNCPITDKELLTTKSIEVGHIFYLGTRYSKVMNACTKNEQGILTPVEMSSYGIGISRLVAAIIEASHDEKGIIWPVNVAPFKVSIINLNFRDTKCNVLANYVYNYLKALKVDVLYDDTDERAGSKFMTHDLIGIPWQIIIGNKNANEDMIELKHRVTFETETLPVEMGIKQLVGNLSVK